MKKIIFILAILFTISISAQSNYDIVILPKKFSFLKEENKYNLNALTKNFFETEGFKVFYAEDALPKEVANNRCNSLFADVTENNGLFMSRLTVVLSDCQNNIVFSSAEGSSREKEYQKAYTEALRFALTSMRGNLKIKNPNSVENTKVTEKPVVEVETIEVKEITPVVAEVVKHNEGTLFALPIENGYKLVDSVPNVIYMIHNSSEGNVFIASKGEIHGVFQKKINGWYFDYYQDGKLISEKVSVKF